MAHAGTTPRRRSAAGLTIAEVAERTGLSKDTLRYYEKAGLLAAVDRSSGGQRRYAEEDVGRLDFLLRPRATGMPVADMRRFADLRRGGDGTVPDRLELLREHQARVRQRIADLQQHGAALTHKIEHYEALIDEPIHEGETS